MAVLELRNVRKTFGSAVAVESSNLTIEPGEFVSFLGPSGCGKTTTLRMIAGLETPTSGEISLARQDITHTPIHKRHIGMVFQSYALFPTMTVADNIGFGLRVSGTTKPVIAARVRELLDMIGMTQYSGRFPHQLSGGQQQRVALARALANQPRMLLLDEPLSALDAQIRDSLRREIRDIQRRLGITTVYVTHDQQEALALSDRIVVMRAGHIEQVGTPLHIYQTPANSFVAGFVGQVNMFEAAVADAQSVVFGGERVVVRAPIRAAIGATVRCYVRPEAVTLDAAAAEGLGGIVTRLEYSGMTTQVAVRSGDDVWQCTGLAAAVPAGLQVGAPVRIRLGAGQVGVWE